MFNGTAGITGNEITIDYIQLLLILTMTAPFSIPYKGHSTFNSIRF